MAGGAAAAAAIAQAIKASGVIVRVEPEAFMTVLERQDEPLVVLAEGGFFGPSYRYLTSYKGLAFFTQTSKALQLPGRCELIQAEKIWIP
jgi:hypothetical protein